MKIPTVPVFALNYRQFTDWLRTQPQGERAKYIYIARPENIRGRRFKQVVELCDRCEAGVSHGLKGEEYGLFWDEVTRKLERP